MIHNNYDTQEIYLKQLAYQNKNTTISKHLERRKSIIFTNQNLLNKHIESLLVIGKTIDRLYVMKFKGIR